MSLPIAASDLDTHLGATRRVLVNHLWLSFGFIGLYVVGFNIWRIAARGWSPYFAVLIAIGLWAVGMAILRKRLSFRFKAIAAVGVLYLPGLLSMRAFGMGGISFFWLVEASLVAAALFSMRAGIRVMALAMVLLIVTAIAFTNGWVQPLADMNRWAVSTPIWLNYVVIAPVFPAVLLYAIGHYQKTIETLLDDIRAQRDGLAIMATHDQLTGLPVRHLVHDRLHQALYAARRSGHKVGVLFIDLDGFKAINDDHGHAAGDSVLRTVAKRLRTALRAEDTVGRFGGDEFVVVLYRLPDSQDARPVAEKLMEAITQPLEFAGRPLTVGASVGIAVFPDHGDDPESLCRAADRAMYGVKRGRKNAVGVAVGEVG